MLKKINVSRISVQNPRNNYTEQHYLKPLYTHCKQLHRTAKRCTRTFQVRTPKGVGVRVPLPALH